jgi:hypothetical protein
VRFDSFQIEFDENRCVKNFKLKVNGAEHNFGFDVSLDPNDLQSLIVEPSPDGDLELRKEYRVQIDG